MYGHVSALLQVHVSLLVIKLLACLTCKARFIEKLFIKKRETELVPFLSYSIRYWFFVCVALIRTEWAWKGKFIVQTAIYLSWCQKNYCKVNAATQLHAQCRSKSLYVREGCWLKKRHNCHNARSCLLSTTNVTAYQWISKTSVTMVFWHENDKRQICHRIKLKQKQVYLHASRYVFLLYGNTNNKWCHKNAS